MALRQADKEAIKALGLDPEKLIEAVKADAEVEFAVPKDVTVIANTALTERDNNNKAIGKTEGETAGEKKGKELAAKAFKKKFNLPDTVPADIDKVVEEAHKSVAKGDAGLQEQVNLLQKDKETMAAELKAEQARSKAAQFDSQLIGYFPANRTGDLNDSERLGIVKASLQFEEVDGKTVVKKNGEILRDKATQNPLAPNQVINEYFTERKWIGEVVKPGGRGGGNNPPGSFTGIKTASAFEEKWKAENPGQNIVGDDYMNALAKQAKDTEGFDWNA